MTTTRPMDGIPGTRPMRRAGGRVALTIARLIGRQIAREHSEALQAANDDKPFKTRTGVQEDRPCEDDDQ